MKDLGRLRTAFGRVGVYLPDPAGPVPPVEIQRAAARSLEEAGYRALWVNEGIGGRDALVQAALLLAATNNAAVGIGVATMWARPAQTLHAAASLIADGFPDRFVVGLGVGHPPQAQAVGLEWGQPVPTLRSYLERVTTASDHSDLPFPFLIAANGPRMLSLASEYADGAMPAMATPDAIAGMRATLGADTLLVCFLPASADPAQAPALVESLRGQLRSGADHVAVGIPLGFDWQAGIDYLIEIAPLLRDLA